MMQRNLLPSTHNLELLTDQESYNYVAYLVSDINSTSIKVAKYRVMIEYITKITSRERENNQNYLCRIIS